MKKERIKLTDTTMGVVIKMSEGNPGAMNVLMEMLNSKIDIDNAFGGLGSILSLDSYGIYGTDIYILFNDICESDLAKTIAVLRSVQLGFLNQCTLKDACSRQDRSGKNLISVEELYIKVKEKLPNFNN